MNFYFDFEASQYTERIISIGVVAENGAAFDTLVKLPEGDKVGDFVSHLTHITDEMLAAEDVPTADKAFAKLDLWMLSMSQGSDTSPCFYCYGDSDPRFLRKTVKKMNTYHGIMCATALAELMVDYSPLVKQHLAVKGISLKKLTALVRHVESVEQNHDALDDAYMLKECFEGLGDLTPEDVPVPASTPAEPGPRATDDLPKLNYKGRQCRTHITRATIKTLATVRAAWASTGNWKNSTGDATEENYAVKMIHNKTGQTLYFSSLPVCATYVSMKLTSTSCTKPEVLHTRINNILNNPNNYKGFYFEIKESELV